MPFKAAFFISQILFLSLKAITLSHKNSLPLHKLIVEIRLHIICELVYTLANCGVMWGKVGQKPAKTLEIHVKMDRSERMFYYTNLMGKKCF